MDSLLLLIPLSALIVVAAAIVFFRAVDNGQFDDLERQGRVTLFEEPGAAPDDRRTAASTDSSSSGSRS